MKSYRTDSVKHMNNNGSEFGPGCLIFIVGFIVLIFFIFLF